MAKGKKQSLFDAIDEQADLSVPSLDAPTRIASSSGSLPRLNIDAIRREQRRALPSDGDATPPAPTAAIAPASPGGLEAMFEDLEDLEVFDEQELPTRVGQVSSMPLSAALDAIPNLEEDDEDEHGMPTRVASATEVSPSNPIPEEDVEPARVSETVPEVREEPRFEAPTEVPPPTVESGSEQLAFVFIALAALLVALSLVFLW